MAIKDGKKEESVKTAEGIDLTLTTNVRFIYRDLAITWPSTDAGAENINVFQDYLSLLFQEGWKIEAVQIYERKPVGDMVNEFVIPVFLLLVK